MAFVRIVGSYLSPYVRKVLVCLHLKGEALRAAGAETLGTATPRRGMMKI